MSIAPPLLAFGKVYAEEAKQNLKLSKGRGIKGAANLPQVNGQSVKANSPKAIADPEANLHQGNGKARDQTDAVGINKRSNDFSPRSSGG